MSESTLTYSQLDPDKIARAVFDEASGLNRSGLPSSIGTPINLPSSTSSQVLFAANPARKGFMVDNNSNSTAYVAYFNPATSTNYTLRLPAGTAYESENIVYSGIITIVWASANGFAMGTELT